MRLFPVLALALALALPTTALASGWSGKGGHEPDTTYDVQGGWMFTQPDITPCTQSSSVCSQNDVYLNGWLAQTNYPNFFGWSLNPNAGEVGSAFMVGGFWQFNALFGVWKDCNADGYIGLLDQGLMEYRSAILHDWPGIGDSICPPTTTPLVRQTGLPPVGWMPSHNDGDWVREYIPFEAPGKHGVAPAVASNDPWVIDIGGTDTAMWADFGLPGPLGSRVGCQLNQPYGTFRTTGGMVNYADCLDGYHVIHTFDGAAESTPQTRPFSFGDRPDGDAWESSSRANLWNPWGNESDASFVSPWDCRSHPVARVDVPAQHSLNQGERDYANVSAPAVPPQHSTTGSGAGTANTVGSGFDQCDRNPASESYVGGSSGGAALTLTSTTLFGGRQPYYGRDLASAPYGWEGGAEVPYRTGTTDMSPGVDWIPGGWLVATGEYGNRPVPPISGVLGKSTPGDLGAHTVDNQGVWQGGLFLSEPLVDYTALPASPNPVLFTTTYARLDPSIVQQYSLSLPATPFGGTLVTGTYGAEACGGFTTGVHNGWDCDATHWHSGAKPGAAYELRDVDCYDESVTGAREAGIGWGLASGSSCPTP